MTITLLRGGWVAAGDGRQHQVLAQGEVAFKGDEILY
jgi:hypothetical protein